MYYFAPDGSYGEVTPDFVIVNASDFSANDWQEVDLELEANRPYRAHDKAMAAKTAWSILSNHAGVAVLRNGSLSESTWNAARAWIEDTVSNMFMMIADGYWVACIECSSLINPQVGCSECD